MNLFFKRSFKLAHMFFRFRTMTDQALRLRIRKIRNVPKMRSFVQVGIHNEDDSVECGCQDNNDVGWHIDTSVFCRLTCSDYSLLL